MCAPWDVNDTTSPSIVLPIGWSATKVMKVIGSLRASPAGATAGGRSVGGLDRGLGGRAAWPCWPWWPWRPSWPALRLGGSAFVALVSPWAALVRLGRLLGLGCRLVTLVALAAFVRLGGLRLVALVALARLRGLVALTAFVAASSASRPCRIAVPRRGGRRRLDGLVRPALRSIGAPARLGRGPGDRRRRPSLTRRSGPVGAVGGSPPSASRLDLAVTERLRGPRTGVRGVKTQPTPGTGLPPISRPASNSQGRSAWNSWNESLDSTRAPDFSAMRRMKPSPRPTAPAGGVTISPCSMASSNARTSDGSIRWPKEASTTTVTSAAVNPLVLLQEGPDRLVQLGQAG